MFINIDIGIAQVEHKIFLLNCICIIFLQKKKYRRNLSILMTRLILLPINEKIFSVLSLPLFCFCICFFVCLLKIVQICERLVYQRLFRFYFVCVSSLICLLKTMILDPFVYDFVTVFHSVSR